MTLTNPAYYFNRELSWLAFNERVLEEALDKTNPLMERLKFLAITASNLDEFFMVRVSSLWEKEGAGPDAAGMTPRQQLSAISLRAHELVARQYDCLKRGLLPALEKENIRVLPYAKLSPKQQAYAARYFTHMVYPVLTPMAIDQSRPFPTVNNRTLHLFAELSPDETGRARYALVQVPTVLPRLLPLPGPKNGHDFILLEALILAHLGQLFLGQTVTRTALLRVTRNSDLAIDEEEIEDLLDIMERSIQRRRWGDPVRLELSGMAADAQRFLAQSLDLDEEEIYTVNGPLDLTVWMSLATDAAFAALRNKPQPPKPAAAFIEAPSLFDVIRRRDVLVHHPYMGFDCVTRFVREASADPQVLAIKQTLYRVSGESPIVDALMSAAENGKQVTVLVELRARFDEENNIHWAKKLEHAGVHVIYGLIGLKTHCKLCLVVRREDDGIRRYVHLSTGNYNDATAQIYTDTGYFTCQEAFGQDSSQLFNVLTGYSRATEWRKFAVAPLSLRGAFLQLIDTEAKNARAGSPAAITAKMNSLTDTEIIQALYRAAMAGVRIRLLVRGQCCLKTALPGISEGIEVSSIVDRYLEHTRIFCFENGGQPRVFLSSADWMPRNMERRVEVLFPIEDAALRGELTEMLKLALRDNVKRRVQQPDGAYRIPSRRGQRRFQFQTEFYRRVAEAYDTAQATRGKELFKPILKLE